MSLTQDVRSLLTARAAVDPIAARLLEMFTRVDESLSGASQQPISYVEPSATAIIDRGKLEIDRQKQADRDDNLSSSPLR